MDNKKESVYQALEAVARLTQQSDASWLVGGSTGLMLRGLYLDQGPRDLDLYADDKDAVRLHQLLKPFSVDEQVEDMSGIYRSLLSHYSIYGVSIELVGGFVIDTNKDRYEVEVNQVLVPHMDTVQVGGMAIGIVPLAHEMWFNVLRMRVDRTQLIADALRNNLSPHQNAFFDIEARNKLSVETAALVHRLLGMEESGDGHEC